MHRTLAHALRSVFAETRRSRPSGSRSTSTSSSRSQPHSCGRRSRSGTSPRSTARYRSLGCSSPAAGDRPSSGPSATVWEMLGLPDDVRACLFDLDGVLTQTAKVHAAAWKQTFDDYPARASAAQTGEPFVPFDPVERLRRVRRRQAALRRRALVPRLARDRAARGHARRLRRRDETVNGLGNRKNEIVLRADPEHGVEAYDGSVRYVQAARERRPAPGGRLLERQLPRRARAPPASRTCSRRVDRRRDRRARAPERQARPRHLPRRARARSACEPRRRPCSRTRWRASRPGAPASFGFVVGRRPRRPGRRAARARRRRRRRRPRASCWSAMIQHPAFPVEPWSLRETEPRSRPARPDRVGVRALQRAHRPARQPRRGRAVRAAGHVPERLLRGAAAAVRRGRLRLPGGRPDGRQRDQRQDHPPARRGRAVRRPLRRAASATSACSTCAPACCGARVEWVLADRPRGRVSSTRLVSFTQRAIAAILLRGRAARRRDARWSSSPSWSPTSRCRRTANDPRAAAALASPLRPELFGGARARARAGAPHARRAA